MARVFVPYTKDDPAAIEIKGHRLLILSTEADDLLIDLGSLGGDTIRELKIQDTAEEQTKVLSELAEKIRGGVVITPPGVRPSIMIENLRQELPWVH